MDAVYILGKGSIWNDTELKYSLRSLGSYCYNIDNVYLVGERPSFLNGRIIHVPANDLIGKEWKEYNIMRKIYAACKLRSLSKEFLFLNDDHFLLKSFSSLPFYHKGTLAETLDTRGVQDLYYQSLKNTRGVLEANKLPTLNYDVHSPIVYDKHEFVQIMDAYDWSVYGGYVVKSLYCNTLGVTGEYIEDLKINTRTRCKDIDALTTNRPFFSVGDGAVGSEMEMFLNYLYPKKSKFER